MKNQSVSDFVAASMNAVLNSKEHKSLFDVQYKYAQDMNAAKDSCSECGSKHDGDSCMADDDNDARKAKKDDEDSSMAWDDNDARKKKDSDEDSSDADDNDARKKKDSDEDSSSASDGLEPSAAFDVAIDSLLTASAALDSVGLGRGSALVLKIASLTVEAKKKEKDSKKDSKKSSKDSQSAKDKKSKDSKDSKKSSKDSQSAKDKKSSDKKDSKKDSKDSKKSNPFAKKK